MKKVKIQRSKFKSVGIFSRKTFYLLLTFFTFNFLLLTFTTVDAADSSPSADIQKQLQQLEQEIASKAASLKKTISNQLQNRAFVGVVNLKTDSTITLATRNGTKLVNINQDTRFYSDDPKVKKYSLKQMTEEDNIAAMGDVDDTGVLTAREIDIEPAPKPAKQIIWGHVLSVSGQKASIQDKDNKNIAVSLANVDTTVKVQELVIVTGVTGKNSITEADFVYQINQDASPSASPTSSSSTNPSPLSSSSKK